MTKTYLITGATGATGGAAADLLLNKGQKVRALVHRLDERSEKLKIRGAEIMVGDLTKFHDVRTALEGMEGAYFVYPIVPGIIEATTYFAQAAKEAKVQHIVNMSQVSARRAATSGAALNHWIAEQVFDWSGVPTTHIRPTFFMEWLLYYVEDMKKEFIKLPFSTGKHAPISSLDQGNVVANILVNPAAHQGKIYKLYGDKEYTFPELIEIAETVLERKIRYEKISYEEFETAWTNWGRAYLGQHLKEVAKDHTAGIFAGTNNLVKEITGKSAETVEEFLQKNAGKFTS